MHLNGGESGETRMTKVLGSIASRVVAVATSAFLLCSIALAQAPEGPQTSAPPQANPVPQQKQTPPKQQAPPEAGVTIAVEVPVVTLYVIAATQHGDLIPGLKKENFRILEDGQPQSITTFGQSDDPITMVLLMEFSARSSGWFAYQAKYWADALFPNLKPKDWVALVTFDMNTRTDVDFTQNKDKRRLTLYPLYFP